VNQFRSNAIDSNLCDGVIPCTTRGTTLHLGRIRFRPLSPPSPGTDNEVWVGGGGNSWYCYSQDERLVAIGPPPEFIEPVQAEERAFLAEMKKADEQTEGASHDGNYCLAATLGADHFHSVWSLGP
jgi:hypothetical protein